MMSYRSIVWGAFLAAFTGVAQAEQPVIPHAQDKAPNEPRDAATAAKLMTVPEGFVVEVVAHEPDIVNPVAMTFDEKGRVWITESLEYPRKEPGPGKDRVKILEDTDGDGVMDKFSVFLDGLNIPSGVAVGHGGVWIANSPDILFVPDADRDGKADGPAQVVVTGFGRTDTHELPNSLTWGPDGWLYGLNGVFNHSHVKYSESNPNFRADHPGWKLTCVMYRIHPRTREFQVFAEGTSNPWGIAFDDEGEAFISACVIDHLWHIVETGYYHRQGGPYPPHTWKIESIVEHKHQKAAYCGITWFDSDAYPEKYRRKLYMGNIHGGCINVDRVERNGSTYKGFGEPDFLTANDSWFMPVVQKTGPDGCLWILDWYDRYHCYQDAGRDPGGIDRLKGRLYRVRYTGNPSGGRKPPESAHNKPLTSPFDLGSETDDQLIERLGSPNVWIRETAQRVLQERDDRNTLFKLLAVIENTEAPNNARRHALFSVAGMKNSAWPLFLRTQKMEKPILPGWPQRLLHTDPVQRIATAKEYGKSKQLIRFNDSRIASSNALPRTGNAALQQVIGLSKQPVSQLSVSLLLQALSRAENDSLLPHIIWQAMHPKMEDHAEEFVAAMIEGGYLESPEVAALLPRVTDRILARQKFEPELVARLLKSMLDQQQARAAAGQVLAKLSEKIETGELAADKVEQLRTALAPVMQPLLQNGSEHALQWEASLLALSWKDQTAVEAARKLARNPQENAERRAAALNALIAAKSDGVIDIVAGILKSKSEISPLKSQILQSAGRLDDPRIAEIVLASFVDLPPDVQPRAVELLTQRAAWAKALLAAVGKKQVPAELINLNLARRMHELKDDELAALLKQHWGEVRNGRNPDRERIVGEMKSFIRQHKGDELAGEKVFKKVCGQCHKLYGEGAEVGPDITRNGRNDFQQLLSNVFDPSLIIGAGYRSFTVVTHGGRVINGLLVEDSPQRIVLKVQGGKQEIIPRDDVDEFNVSEISLMPEQLEKQISPTEIADLFAYITLNKPPQDATAKRLAGVYEIVPRETTNPSEFAAIFQEVGPGFTSATSGERGIGLLTEYRGRAGVVRTHPIDKDKAAIMKGKFLIPKDKKTTLIVEASHEEGGDWRLLGGGRGERLLDELVDKESCPDGWGTFTADLTKFAGQEIEVQVWNQANNWSHEFGYWGSVRIVSE